MVSSGVIKKLFYESLFAALFCFCVLIGLNRFSNHENRSNPAVDLNGKWGAAGVQVDLQKTINHEFFFGQWEAPKRRYLAPLINSVSFNISQCTSSLSTSNGNSQVNGACFYVQQLPGCCTTNPTIPPYDTLCPSLSTITDPAQISSIVSCKNLFVSYICSTNCLAYANESCNPQWNLVLTTCAQACPNIASLFSGPVTNATSNNSFSNCTLRPLESTPLSLSLQIPQTTYQLSSTVPTASVSLTLNAYSTNPPELTEIHWNTGTQIFYSFQVPVAAWTTSSSNGWSASVTNVLIVDDLYGSPQWTFNVSFTAWNALGFMTSIPPVTVVVSVNQSSAPTSYGVVNVCGTNRDEGSRSFAPTTTAVATATCDCPTQCMFTGVTVSFTIFSISSDTVVIALFLVIVDSIQMTKDSEMHVQDGAVCVFGPVFHSSFVFAFTFTGTAASTINFYTGSSVTIQKAVSFNGPTVIISGILVITSSASATVNAGTVSLNASSQVTVSIGCTFVVQGTALLIGLSGIISGSGRFNHRGGVVRFFFMIIQTPFFVGVGAPSRSQRRPGATPLSYLCGSTMGSITVAGTLDVDLSLSCGVVASSYSMTATDITILSGGVLWIGNTTVGSLPILVTPGPFTWNSGGWVSVDLIQQPTSGSAITVLRFPASASSCVIPAGVNAEVLANGFTLVGTFTLIATVDPTNAGMCLIQVYSTHSSSTSPNPGSFVMGSTFSVTLSQDCTTFGPSNAISIVGQFYNVARVSFTTRCGSTILSFVCSGSSASDADSYCQTIYNDIINPNSQLYALLKPITSTSSGSGGSNSNNGLYGLLALIAIPVALLVILAFWFLRGKPQPDPNAFAVNENDCGAKEDFQMYPASETSYAHSTTLATTIGGIAAPPIAIPRTEYSHSSYVPYCPPGTTLLYPTPSTTPMPM